MSNSPEYERWERLLAQQNEIYKTSLQRDKELVARVTELERELSVWKLAFTAADSEKNALNKTVTELQRSLGSLKEDNPLVLCLIDGDGCIFSPELLSLGQAGGRQAAQLLTKGITDYISATSAGRAQILASIYLNKLGLQETLTSCQICTPQQFDSFMNGFNQASPLFSIVDVGNGKEAADAKLREHLRIFARFPQTLKMFFGGSHDNGYTSTLNSLENEGYLDKVVVLQGYKHIASEIKPLDLPAVEIEGLFMTQKLPSQKKIWNFPPPATPVLSHSELASENHKHSKEPKNRTVPLSPSKGSVGLKSKSREDKKETKKRHHNTPCNYHYLTAGCRYGSSCGFAHDLDLSEEDIRILRKDAKKTPCPSANRDKPCKDGEDCPHGHTCPRGPKCEFFKEDRCKFSGKNMHNFYPKYTQWNSTDSHSRTSSNAATSSNSDFLTSSSGYIPLHGGIAWNLQAPLLPQEEEYIRYCPPSPR